MIRKTLEELNVHHVTIAFYHPTFQSNGNVESLHKTMHDILPKRICNNNTGLQK